MLLLVRPLLLVAMHLFLIAYCFYFGKERHLLLHFLHLACRRVPAFKIGKLNPQVMAAMEGSCLKLGEEGLHERLKTYVIF